MIQKEESVNGDASTFYKNLKELLWLSKSPFKSIFYKNLEELMRSSKSPTKLFLMYTTKFELPPFL